MKYWGWFLNVYLFYLAIYVFLQIANGFPSTLFWIFIVAGNAFGIFATYRLISNSKITLRKLLRLILFSLYTLFVIFNTFVFSVWIVFEFGSFFSEIPESILDKAGLVFPIIALYPVTKILTNYRFSSKSLLAFFWTGYLWTVVIIFGGAFLMLLLDILKWTAYDYLMGVLIVFPLIGILSYYFKFKVFPRKLWQLVFWGNIIWSIVDFIYNFTALKEYLIIPNYLKSYSPPVEYSLPVYLTFLAFLLPAYFPLFKIAFDKNFFRKN